MPSPPPQQPIASQIDRLQRPIAGRRWLSWLLFVAVLVVTLVWPALPSIAPDFVENARRAGWWPAVPARLDTLWNPGTLSSVHEPWAHDCKACHSTPFVRVQDQDCLACHKATGDHVDARRTPHAGLQDLRCASCHREHQGSFGLASQNKAYVGEQCGACHGDIRQGLPATTTANVSDFATGHPAFRVQVAQAPGRLARVRAGGQARVSEPTALKFPHDMHLAAAGVQGPQGNVKLECASCHRPTPDGIGFLPVTMKGQCQSCHALKFDTALFNREVPHGSVEEALSTLREAYSHVGLNRVTPPLVAAGPVTMLRPGQPEPGTPRPAASPSEVRRRATMAATDLFEKTACVVCHEVTRLPGPGRPGTAGRDLPQWRIAPPAPVHAWMPQARFHHARHRGAECSTCHDAARSKNAADVLMPDIATCRDCHAGSRPEKNKVVSDCGLCHGFHPSAENAPGGPSAGARKEQK